MRALGRAARPGAVRSGSDRAAAERALPGMGRSARRPLLVLVAIAIGVAVYRSAHHQHPPPLATSCRVPALALSSSSVARDGVVLWSATGPPGRYLLAIDAVGASVAGHSVRLVPPPGKTAAQLEVASLPRSFTHCRATGEFTVVLGRGRHQVRLFPLDVAGAPAAASVPLTVTR